MRIGISALFHASGGTLTNLAQLLTGWSQDGTLERHSVLIFASPGTRGGLQREVSAAVLERVTVRVISSSGRGLVKRFLSEQISMVRWARDEQLDVIFCPGNVIPFLAKIPTVVTFQNAAPFCESASLRKTRSLRWLEFRLMGWLMRLSAVRATRMIFISNYFRDLFVERFDVDRRKSVVIPRASEPKLAAHRDEELARTLGIEGPYLLSVSNLNPYKNGVELIEAFALAIRTTGDPSTQLVLAGRVNFEWYRRRLDAAVKREGLEGRVILTGELPHEAIESLLLGCQSFLFTSTCENCPTALVEAMTFGLAIASSDLGVMPEIGGDAVLYFDPYSIVSISEVIVSLLKNPDLVDELREKAVQRAATFPGVRDMAARTMAVLSDAAEGR